MIVATNKCGCPPPSDDSCLPGCAGKSRGKPPDQKSRGNPPDQSCPASPCCGRQAPQPVDPSPAIGQDCSPCCPVDPCASSEEERKSVRSEIAESGLPFKELEALINENRLVIRTQDEPARPEFEPPCDCIEETLPKRKEDDIGAVPGPGKRTVTLYPRVKVSDTDVRDGRDRRSRNQEQPYEALPRTIDQEENPNIFLLRIKKQKTEGDKKFRADLEFRTARPWSREMRAAYEKLASPAKPCETMPTVPGQAKRCKPKKKKKKKK